MELFNQRTGPTKCLQIDFKVEDFSYNIRKTDLLKHHSRVFDTVFTGRQYNVSTGILLRYKYSPRT